MAIMRKEQRDIDGLGPIGIVREALKVFCAHAKVFTLIQLALMLDLAILSVGVQYFLYQYLPHPDPQPDHGPNTARPLYAPRLGHHFKMSFHGGSAGLRADNSVLLLLGISAFSLLFQVALSLPLSATIYSLGLHYTGQAFSFVDVVRACTPRLWMRLALTNTYASLIEFAVTFVESVFNVFIIQYSFSLVWKLSSIVVFLVLVLVGLVYILIIFTIASGVSVLDDDYGWASVTKSLKLLKGKKIVAFLVQLLLVVPALISFALQSAVRSGFEEGDYSPWTLTLLLIAVVAYLGWTTFICQFQALCAGVQYVSFKAYHDESLAGPLEKRSTKEGYEPIGDGSAALLGEQQDIV